MSSCWDRIQTGGMLGGAIGLCVGTMYGLFAFSRAKEIPPALRIQLIGKSALTSAAGFGFFLMVGSGIRCESGIKYSPSQVDSIKNQRKGIFL